MNLPAVIDNAPILAREVRRVKDWFRKADRLDAGHDRFAEVDLPQFRRWHDETFGDVQREIETKRREFYVLADLYDQVIGLANMENMSMVRAYRIIRDENLAYDTGDQALRAHIDRRREARRTWWEDQARARFAKRDEVEEQSPPENAQGVFEFSFDGDDEHVGNLEQGAEPAGASPAKDERLRVEAMFKIIVRKIHPDTVDEILKKKNVEWLHRTWTRAVRARAEGDLEQLIVVHGQILVAARQLQTLGVADLRSLVSALAIVHARRKLAVGQAHRNLAWNFSKLKSRDKLRDRLKSSYAADLYDTEANLREMRTVRAGWERAVDPETRARRGRQRSRARR